MASKILLLDVETKPNLAYVWGLHDQHIGLDMLVKPQGIMCWAAKFYKEKTMHFGAEWHGEAPYQELNWMEDLHALLCEADAVVTYNGNKFDLPRIRGEFIARKLPPMPPVTSIDLYSTSRKLGYPSGKLTYVCQHLGLGKKAQHAGFDTWVGAMEGIASDQRVMERYNKKDVILLEKLYSVLRPHIKEHPYLGTGDAGECPTCHSKHIQKRGTRRTAGFIIDRLNCQDCGSWFSGKRTKAVSVVE
jgi:hypothetical protein